MLELDIEPTSGQALLDAMRGRWQEKNEELQQQKANTPLNLQAGILAAIQDNDDWKEKWERRMKDHANFPTIRTEASFSDIGPN